MGLPVAGSHAQRGGASIHTPFRLIEIALFFLSQASLSHVLQNVAPYTTAR
jgi:hypothetical protein